MFNRIFPFILILLSAFTFFDCGSSHYAFGTSSEDKTNLASIDVSDIYSGRSDGLQVCPKDHTDECEFVQERTLYLPPGQYILQIASLYYNTKSSSSNSTFIDSAYFTVPLDVSQGENYLLNRNVKGGESIDVIKVLPNGKKNVVQHVTL